MKIGYGLLALIGLGCFCILLGDLVFAEGIISVGAINWSIGYITFLSVIGLIVNFLILCKGIKPFAESSHLGIGLAWLGLIVYVQFPFATFFYWVFCASCILSHINVEYRPYYSWAR